MMLESLESQLDYEDILSERRIQKSDTHNL